MLKEIVEAQEKLRAHYVEGRFGSIHDIIAAVFVVLDAVKSQEERLQAFETSLDILAARVTSDAPNVARGAEDEKEHGD